MSPLIVVNRTSGHVQLVGGDACFTESAQVMGGSGGSKIISGVAYVASRLLHRDDDVKQAIDAPRLHNQLTPNTLQVESGVPHSVMEALAARGWPTLFGQP